MGIRSFIFECENLGIEAKKCQELNNFDKVEDYLVKMENNLKKVSVIVKM